MDEPIRSAFEAVHASELSRQRTKLFVRKKTHDYNSRRIRQSASSTARAPVVRAVR